MFFLDSCLLCKSAIGGSELSCDRKSMSRFKVFVFKKSAVLFL